VALPSRGSSRRIAHRRFEKTFHVSASASAIGRRRTISPLGPPPGDSFVTDAALKRQRFVDPKLAASRSSGSSPNHSVNAAMSGTKVAPSVNARAITLENVPDVSSRLDKIDAKYDYLVANPFTNNGQLVVRGSVEDE
jgi:hypothetical protein